MQPWIDANEAAISVVEAIEHFKSLPNFPQRQALLRALLRQVRPYALTYEILEDYADIRRAMRPPHGPGLIDDIDTLIGATGRAHNLTVVTIDSEYIRVPNLPVMHLPRNALL